jgi:hypothetical protein
VYINRLSLVLLVSMFASVEAAQAVVHNGVWWSRLSNNEQFSFVDGYGTCSVADEGRSDLNGKPLSELTDRVSKYYSTPAASRDRLVDAVLFEVARDVRSRHPMQSGDKYGAADGELWRQTAKAARTIWVGGYLTCYRRLTPKTKFSKSDATYADEITTWYRIVEDQDGSDLDPKRASAKIPNVLRRFQDGARSRP